MILRELRLEKKVTQKEVGDAIGMAESTISLYESGKRQADYETLLKLAEFFDCTLDHLLGRDALYAKKDAPAELSDKDIMFALLDGDSDEISDDVFNEVKAFAQFRAEQKRQEKGGAKSDV